MGRKTSDVLKDGKVTTPQRFLNRFFIRKPRRPYGAPTHWKQSNNMLKRRFAEIFPPIPAIRRNYFAR